MAKRRSSVSSVPEWKPPTPEKMREDSIKRAAEAATLAHPLVKRVQQTIERDMRSAATPPAKALGGGLGGKKR